MKEETYKIPNIILNIMKKIENKGFTSFVVGGYVRDLLLGKTTIDIDICTNAPLNILKKLFKGKIFKEYSSIHLKEGIYNIDITTFREELEYENNKPTKIIYTNKLYNDLLRRDFTINSLAIDINGNLIDMLGGLKDLKENNIKVIGSTYDKLIEDKTRILRAIRFSSVLGFKLSNEIKNFLKEKGFLIETLPKEYIKSELDKIFEEDSLLFFDILKKYNLSSHLHLKYDKINSKVSSSYAIWSQIQTDLPFKREERTIINSIKKIIEKGQITKFDIYKYGESECNIASEILKINIDELIKNMPIRSIFDIDINYKEIKQITPNINKAYKDIEKQIVLGNLKNNKSEILKYLKGRKYE